MDAATYWKLVALQERAAKVREQAKWAVARAESAYAEAMTAAGFDPRRPATFNDTTHEVTQAEAEHA